MDIVMTRYDGVFLIGQMEGPQVPLHNNVFFNPACIVHMPIQLRSQIANQAAIAYQTNIVFLEIEWLRLPANIVVTNLAPTERLAKHYLASLDLFLKTSADQIKAH